MVYYVYDRLSKRHKWQILGGGESKEYVDNLVKTQLKKVHEKYKEYQIGVLKKKFDPFQPSELPKNKRMDEIYT
jgi:hypothetical protein